jgi:hypothetical protein
MVPLISGLVGAVVALGLAALIWWAVSGHSGPSQGSGAGTTTTTSSAGSLSGQALVLSKLLTSGNAVTYHATYTLTSTDPETQGGSVGIEVWRQPPQERQDSSANVPGSPSQHTEALELSSGLVSCTQSGTGQWSCSSLGQATPTGPDAIIKQITGSLAGDQVSVHNATVSGMAARCFDLVSGSTKLSLCVNKQGIPVEVTDGVNTMVATEVDHHVASGTFKPPAPVSSTTSTSSSA